MMKKIAKIIERRTLSMLTPKDIAAMLDHSTLQPFLTDADIQRGCKFIRI